MPKVRENKRSRLGNLFRFLSTQPTAGYQNHAVDYESQAQLQMDYEEEQARQLQTVPSSVMISADQANFPPTNFPQQKYPFPHRRYAQDPAQPPQLYDTPAANTTPTSVPRSTVHVCELCAVTERCPVRPTRCPYSGELIHFPLSQPQAPVVTTSSTLQARNDRYRRLEFVEVPAEDGESQPMERDPRERNTRPRGQYHDRERDMADWRGARPLYDPGDYFSDRQRHVVEDWTHKCFEAKCPGWAWGDADDGELDIGGRRAWALAEDSDARSEKAWWMLDTLWVQ